MSPCRIRSLAWLAALLLAGPLAAAPPMREAPNPSATPANQLAVAGGNACGPSALITAFRFGDAKWQRAADAVAGDSERARIWSVIRTYGSRPSNHLSGRARWSRQGVNVVDLCDMANEMTAGLWLPGIRHEILFLESQETQQHLLKRTHQRLETSLKKGLPPVLSIRRFAYRSQAGKAPAWTILNAHFVTVISVPRKLDKNARSFPVVYIDPWGGTRCEGVLAIPDRSLLARPAAEAAAGSPSPCLEAVFPQAGVGKKDLRPGEATVLSVAAAVGRW